MKTGLMIEGGTRVWAEGYHEAVLIKWQLFKKPRTAIYESKL